ncbi:MAG: hypothetical protein AAF569_01115 [Pseudomonadota bacterium]
MADTLRPSNIAFQFGQPSVDTKAMAMHAMDVMEAVRAVPGVEIIEAWSKVVDAMGYSSMVTAMPLSAGNISIDSDQGQNAENIKHMVSDAQDRVTESVNRLTEAMAMLPMRMMQAPFAAMTLTMGGSR